MINAFDRPGTSTAGDAASEGVSGAAARADHKHSRSGEIAYTPIETVNTVATGGSTQTIPAVTVATISYITLTANLTLTFPTAAAGQSFTIVLKQDSTPRSVTWPGTVQWPSGTAPTLTATSAKRDVFTFLCVDGTNFLAFTAAQNL